MGDSYITDTVLAYSTALEDSFNTVPQEAADYTPYETKARIFSLPNVEKQSDDQRIGAGSASAYATFQRSRVLEAQSIEISDTVNVERFPTFLRQHIGRTELSGDIAVVEATKVWKHIFYKRNFDVDGRQLDSRTLICKNNGAYFAYGGGVPGTLQVSQTGIDDPQHSSGYVTSGYYEDVSAIEDFGEMAVPTNDPLKYMLGPETNLSYNDGVLRSLQGRWKSFTFNSNNNIDTGDLRAGSVTRVIPGACPTRGWYRTFLNAQDETVSLECRVTNDTNKREWQAAQEDTVLTAFDILMKGSCVPTTAALNQYAVKISIGKCYFRNPRPADDNNLACVDLTVFPVRNGSYFGVWKAEVTDGKSTIWV